MKLVPPPIEIHYPTSDGRPMAETDIHRNLMFYLIDVLDVRYAVDPMAYVSGNMLMFYQKGNGHRHVSPDVFVVKGIPKRIRDNYLIWEEGKSPDVVFELTSKSTKNEDQQTKHRLYRDILKVPEYFLFDPKDEYLDPPLRGYSLVDGEYVPIDLVDGRLPSDELGVELERQGPTLRLFDAVTGAMLLTAAEVQSERAAKADKRAERATKQAKQEKQLRRQAELETERLRQQIEELRRGQST